MIKRIFCIIFVIIILSTAAFSASALTPKGFEIHAKNAILVSYDTGECIFSKDADSEVNVASLVMLMSSLVIAENCEDLDAYNCEMTLAVKKRYLGTGLAVMNLTQGGKYSVRELLSLALIGSYSDALYLAAITVFGDEGSCIEAMNQRAYELGMTKSVFTDLNGLDETQYSCARDIATLFRTVYANSVLADIVSTRSYTLGPNAHRSAANEMYEEISFSNTCMIINPATAHYFNRVKAGKTGSMTASGRCIVTLGSFEGNSYVCVLLGEPTGYVSDTNGKSVRPDFYDTKNLINWVINECAYRAVINKGDILAEVEVKFSKDNQYVTLAAADGIYATLPKNSDNSTVNVKTSILKEEIAAPIKQGELMGYAEIYYGNELIGRVDLIATNDVESDFWAVLGNSVMKMINSLYFKVFLAILGVMILLIIGIIAFINLRRKLIRRKKVHKDRY